MLVEDRPIKKINAWRSAKMNFRNRHFPFDFQAPNATPGIHIPVICGIWFASEDYNSTWWFGMYSTCDYPWYIIYLAEYLPVIWYIEDVSLMSRCNCDMWRLRANYSNQTAGWSRPQKWWWKVREMDSKNAGETFRVEELKLRKLAQKFPSPKRWDSSPKGVFLSQEKKKQLQAPISDKKNQWVVWWWNPWWMKVYMIHDLPTQLL